MLWWVVAVLCACAAAGAELADTPPPPQGKAGEPDDRVIGGQPSHPGQHPFVVGLFKDGKEFVGSGSLVSTSRVLTAASTIKDVKKITTLVVVLGTVDLHSDGKRVNAIKVWKHNSTNNETDIALLEIPAQNTTDEIQPIKMAQDTEQYAGSRAEVLGYGWTTDPGYNSSKTAILRYALVDVLANEVCNGYYNSNVTAGIVCAAGQGSPCELDDGAPLILYNPNGNHKLIGVYSPDLIKNRDCYGVNVPTGYTRVSYYYDWVRSNMGPCPHKDGGSCPP